METFIEIIFEILLDMLFEGSLEVMGTHKRIPMPLRVLAFVLFFLIVGGIFLILLLAAFSIMEETNVVLGCILALFDILLLGCALYSIRKKLQKRRNAKNETQN